MESVLIVTPFAYDAEFELRLEQLGPVTTGAEGVLFVEDGRSRVYLFRNDWARDELEPDQLERVRSIFAAPVFYSVDFSDIALCRNVLEAIANDPELLVDNDHGVVLIGPEFLRLLRDRPDWDWRLDDPLAPRGGF